MYPQREGLTITIEYRELARKYITAPDFLEEATYRETPSSHFESRSHISMEMVDLESRDFCKLVGYTAEKVWRDIERKLVDGAN